MTSRRSSTASRSTADTTIGSHVASDLTLGTSELARTFDRALHGTGRTERPPEDASPDPSIDSISELTGAVRDFVAAKRAAGSPPERVLATIKRVTLPCLFDGADEARGDRLQALILREFLSSYYDVPSSHAPVLVVPE
jgi:hypothetical protein